MHGLGAQLLPIFHIDRLRISLTSLAPAGLVTPSSVPKSGLDTAGRLGDPTAIAEWHPSHCRREFVKTFDFADMYIEDALRVMMDTYRTPGEAQKIERIMEAFGAWYYESCDQASWAKGADVVVILAFSISMLQTDLHNKQNKRKMSEQQFMRNLRGINRHNTADMSEKGTDPPSDMLSRIYRSIKANEIKLSEDVDGLTYAQLLAIRQDSRHLRGQTLRLSPAECPFIDIMVSFLWGPASASFTVILDHAHDEQSVARALAGIRSLTSIAAHFGMSEVVDSVSVSLVRCEPSRSGCLSCLWHRERRPPSTRPCRRAETTKRSWFPCRHPSCLRLVHPSQPTPAYCGGKPISCLYPSHTYPCLLRLVSPSQPSPTCSAG